MDIDNDDGCSSETGEEELDMVRQAEQNGTARQRKWAVRKFEDYDELLRKEKWKPT